MLILSILSYFFSEGWRVIIHFKSGENVLRGWIKTPTLLSPPRPSSKMHDFKNQYSETYQWLLEKKYLFYF